MNREQKQEQITDIQERFSRMASAVVTDFRGLDVESMNALREEFRKVGVDYKVIKNTLFGLAVKEEAYKADLEPHLEGPTAVAWSYDDPAAPAKVAVGFAKKNENLKIKCAVLDGEILDAPRVIELSKMPGKEELMSTFLATLIAPAQGFVRLVAAAPTNFVHVLDARRRQLEE